MTPTLIDPRGRPLRRQRRRVVVAHLGYDFGFDGDVRRGSAASGAVTGSSGLGSVTQWDGDTTGSVTGTGFTGAMTVSVDGTACSTTYVSSTQLDFTIPGAENSGSALQSSGSKTITVSGSTGSTSFTVAAWSISSISGLTGWFRADAGNVTIATGVSQWSNSTGSNHMTQGTAGDQPAWTASHASFNSQPVVDFVSSDRLDGASLGTYIAAANSWLFIVCRAASITRNDPNSYANHRLLGDTGGYHGLYLKSTGPTALGFNWDGTDDHADATVGAAAGTPEILQMRHTGGNVYIQRRLAAESAATASGNTANTTNALNVGGSSASTWFTGQIAEFAIANAAVSTADRNRAVRYAIVRYAL